MAIPPIRSLGIGQVEQKSNQSDVRQLSQARTSETGVLDGSTSDLSIQKAQRGSLMYQVVSTILNSDTDSQQQQLYNRLLSERLAGNSSFLKNINDTPSQSLANTVVAIESYRSNATTDEKE